MGVASLWETLFGCGEQVNCTNALTGAVLAVDLSVWLCHARSIFGSITNSKSKHRPQAKVCPNPALLYLANKILGARRLGIRFVFVTDGKPSDLKRKHRKNGKYSSQLIKPKANWHPTFARDVREALSFLSLMDCLVVDLRGHDGEAEAMCALLDANGLVDGIVTPDADAFLFGAKRVYKDFSVNAKEKNKPATMLFQSKNIRAKIGLNREQMIGFALLCGSDYAAGVDGVGGKTALRLLDMLEGGGSSCLQVLRGWLQGKPAVSEEGVTSQSDDLPQGSPAYDGMSEAELRKHAENFGLKWTSRSAIVKVLRSLQQEQEGVEQARPEKSVQPKTAKKPKKGKKSKDTVFLEKWRQRFQAHFREAAAALPPASSSSSSSSSSNREETTAEVVVFDTIVAAYQQPVLSLKPLHDLERLVMARTATEQQGQKQGQEQEDLNRRIRSIWPRADVVQAVNALQEHALWQPMYALTRVLGAALQFEFMRRFILKEKASSSSAEQGPGAEGAHFLIDVSKLPSITPRMHDTVVYVPHAIVKKRTENFSPVFVLAWKRRGFYPSQTFAAWSSLGEEGQAGSGGQEEDEEEDEEEEEDVAVTTLPRMVETEESTHRVEVVLPGLVRAFQSRLEKEKQSKTAEKQKAKLRVREEKKAARLLAKLPQNEEAANGGEEENGVGGDSDSEEEVDLRPLRRLLTPQKKKKEVEPVADDLGMRLVAQKGPTGTPKRSRAKKKTSLLLEQAEQSGKENLTCRGGQRQQRSLFDAGFVIKRVQVPAPLPQTTPDGGGRAGKQKENEIQIDVDDDVRSIIQWGEWFDGGGDAGADDAGDFSEDGDSPPSIISSPSKRRKRRSPQKKPTPSRSPDSDQPGAGREEVAAGVEEVEKESEGQEAACPVCQQLVARSSVPGQDYNRTLNCHIDACLTSSFLKDPNALRSPVS